MPGRYFIKTFGCQMNEYDSARMADVLHAAGGLTATDDPAEADVLLMNTCSVREKAQEKVFSLLGEWRAAQEASGRTCSSAWAAASRARKARRITRARAVRRSRVRSADPAPPARHDRRAARAPAAPSSTSAFPEIEKFDQPAGAARRRRDARSSRSWKAAASTARSASCPTRAAMKSAARSNPCMHEVRQLAAQGVREVTLLGQNVNAYAGAMADGAIVDLATLIHHVAAVPGIERIRFTTSHPLEFTRQPHRGLRERAEAREPSAPAGAERLGPRARADEARLHGARIQGEGAQAARRAARTSACPRISSSAFPARPSATSKRR